ncbi:MAG: hypothetical protein ABJH04_07095 [Cyclobacteriaceae bacterium]
MRYIPLRRLFSILFLASCFIIIGSCSSSENKEGVDEEEGEPELGTDVGEPVATTFEFNPTYTWDEFAYGVAGEAYPNDNLSASAEWYIDDDLVPIVLFTTEYEKTINVLLGSNAETMEFNLQKVVLPTTSSVTKYKNAFMDFYDIFEEDLDMDEIPELILVAEVSGMGPADDGDGMQPMHFITAAVLTYKNGEVSYDEKLTEEYKEGVGITEEGGNLAIMELLEAKYVHLTTRPDTNEKREQMKALLMDMDILTTSMNEAPHEFTQVEETDENTFVYNSYESGRYFIKDDNSEFQLDNISSYDYPIFLDMGHDVYAYKIENMKVDGDVVKVDFALLNSESDERDFSAIFMRTNDHWVMVDSNDKVWVTAETGKDFERVSDNAMN